MSGFISKEKAKELERNAAKEHNEPTYSIQPHPAKTNDPADLQPKHQGGGLRGAGHAFQAFDVPGPQIPHDMPAAQSHDELQARQEQLNK
ncbi:hypothetical protein FISHEDRAFT_70098 [Fistulina hepatica ATCC 64428]|uniref:Uncharacterized protein n=1 Tax=Fistulina hepatica ATCC 64428 TaxID=1128425 RepID=A0A0D7AJV5_9AGAR|nr:hypothetical protein FISHEDRAFT_70098 [Fistulina hepatica ATCC 64428]